MIILLQPNLSRQAYAFIPIGFTVVMGILATGNISGGSMNPARSFGPAVAANHYNDVWVYILGPLLGGALGGVPSLRSISSHRVTPFDSVCVHGSLPAARPLCVCMCTTLCALRFYLSLHFIFACQSHAGFSSASPSPCVSLHMAHVVHTPVDPGLTHRFGFLPRNPDAVYCMEKASMAADGYMNSAA